MSKYDKEYQRQYKKLHPEKIQEAKRRYAEKKRKNHGIILMHLQSGKQEYFKTNKDAYAFLGISNVTYWRIKKNDISYKGWIIEEAI